MSQQDLDTARRSRRTAQAQLDSAKQNLALVEAGPREEDIERARAQVRQAKASLEAARAQQVQVKIRAQEREAAEASVAEAEAALRSAEADRRTIDVRQGDVEAARRSVEQAEAALERAESGRLTTAVRRREIDAAMADLSRTQAQLDDQLYSFEHTTIVAPRSGVILTKHVEEGTVVPAGTAALAQGTAIVTIADITEMYVMADVDEVDISRVALKQPVEINVETLPNVEIKGRVDKIFPQGQEETNVVYFPVRIKVLDLHPDLRPGMTVDVSILTAERHDVLLVPDAAIDRSGGMTTVEVLPEPDAEPVQREVEVGVTDWQQTEVISGLKAGETVVLPSGAPGAQMQFGEGPGEQRGGAGRSARRATGMIRRGRR
ncbi:MAG: efflux RND transporter periplasmic adaptor subunit [Armatimonadota bacterium]|nr:efflux RND transporter periplasmic adaptor subunit [Armatimonadota bacterium]